MMPASNDSGSCFQDSANFFTARSAPFQMSFDGAVAQNTSRYFWKGFSVAVAEPCDFCLSLDDHSSGISSGKYVSCWL